MIIQADILDWAKAYTGPKFHALLCDPPYHLTSIVDRFGKVGSAEAQGDVYARAAKGFMGKDWDGGDIAFQPATWAAITQHLYPGAWGMAFAGSRGWHRMAVAIEDAGLIMQPTIFGWGYGNGFPKATRIDTQIDAAAFRAWLKLHPAEQARLQAARLAERAARKARDRNATKETKAALQALTLAYKAAAGLLPATIGTKKHQPKFAAAELGYREKDNGYNSRERETFDVFDCATDAARYWLGHRYGGQAMKPALEPIIVFQKPYDGSPLACITSTGAGALWIDGARIAGDVPSVPQPMLGIDTGHIYGFKTGEGRNGEMSRAAGRWPANLVLSHNPACNGHCAPDCPVAALGAQSGELASGGQVRGTEESVSTNGIYGEYGDRSTVWHGDTGTAARFFFQADYMAERLELADAVAYVAKASRAEREAGLDPRQTALMRLLDDGDELDDFEGRAVYGKMHTIRRCPEHGETARGNHYTCGCATQYDHNFAETTVDDGRDTPIDNPYQRGETTRRNTHPTIKPISLARHLAALLLPPPEYGPRRLLIPFSGAGSEMIGAMLAGWEEITGIELGADHVAIAEARLAYWQQRAWELGDPARKLTVKASAKVPQGQVDMFDSFMDDQRALHQEWIDNPPTFDEWHAVTGGLRDEYDRMSLPPMTHEEWLRANTEEAA